MTHHTQQDVRVAATTRIWGIATGMLGLCIPLTAVADSGPILPIAVISGAAVGTVAVWRSDRKFRTSPMLVNSMKELEQRIENLEIICSSESLDLQKKIKQFELKDK